MRFNDKLKCLHGNVRIKSSIFNIITNNFELNVKKKIVLLKFLVYLILYIYIYIYILFFNLYNIFIIF